METKNQSFQSGNVIFYVLLAVAVVAALTFAVSKNSQTSGETLSTDREKLAVQEIINFSEIVAATANKLRLRGISDTALSFENAIVSDYANANCTTNSCKVFAIGGGGLNYMPPDTSWLDKSFSAQSRYGKWYVTGNLNIAGTSSGTTDLIMALPYVKAGVCERLNETLDLPAPTTVDGYSGTPIYFDGTAAAYTATAAPNIGDTATEYTADTLFCVRIATSEYWVIQVLLSR